MLLAVVILSFIFIVGLCVGSFLNVVILRALSNESIVFPASKCPKCQHKLKWWHNIPVFSYLFLKGKCAFCGEKISIQYPFVELLTGIMFVLLAFKFGLTVDLLFAIAVGCLFIVIAGTDWKEKVVFDFHTFSLIGIGLLYAIVVTSTQLYENFSLFNSLDINLNWFLTNPVTTSVLGAIAGFLIMEIFARAGYLIAGNRAFGEGDSYIAAGLGAVFGWHELLIILPLSVIIQMIVILPVYFQKQIKEKNYMTVLSVVLVLLFAIAFSLLNKYNIFTNYVMSTMFIIVFIAVAIWACINVLKNIRNVENQTFLPFGPALILAGFCMLLIL